MSLFWPTYWSKVFDMTKAVSNKNILRRMVNLTPPPLLLGLNNNPRQKRRRKEYEYAILLLNNVYCV